MQHQSDGTGTTGRNPNTNRGDPNRNHSGGIDEDSDREWENKEDQDQDEDDNRMPKPYYLRRRRNRENRDRDRGSGGGGKNSDSSITTLSKSTANTCCHLIWKLLLRLFAFPFLTPEPICFQRKTKSTRASRRSDPDRVIVPGDPDFIVTPKHCRKVEDLVNFDSKATKNLYKTILERRKEILDMKDKYHYTDVNMTLYPGWTENDINRLRNTFQIFDISGDGLVDLAEIATVLQEFGDKSSSKTIQKNFISFSKTDEFGSINFNDFLSVYHRLTMKPVEDPADQSLTDILKKIDSNMAIRCKLDVLGQLQGGLF